MECGTMHFGEFNPLDVLAAAASLQTTGSCEKGHGGLSASDETSETEDSAEDGIDKDNSEPKTTDTSSKSKENTKDVKFVCPLKVAPGSKSMVSTQHIVKVVSNSGEVSSKIVTNARPITKETPKMTITTNPKDSMGKTLTVLRINKTQNADHSYAVYNKFEKSRLEEDEGYCSRSSLGSPGQCWKSDSEMTDPDVFDGRDIECDPKSPYLILPSGGQTVTCLSPPISGPTTPGVRSPSWKQTTVPMSPPALVNNGNSLMKSDNNKNNTTRKHTKIVIVSRDANLRKYFGGNSESLESKCNSESVPSGKGTDIVKIVSVTSDSSSKVTGGVIAGDSSVENGNNTQIKAIDGKSVEKCENLNATSVINSIEKAVDSTDLVLGEILLEKSVPDEKLENKMPDVISLDKITDADSIENCELSACDLHESGIIESVTPVSASSKPPASPDQCTSCPPREQSLSDISSQADSVSVLPPSDQKQSQENVLQGLLASAKPSQTVLVSTGQLHKIQANLKEVIPGGTKLSVPSSKAGIMYIVTTSANNGSKDTTVLSVNTTNSSALKLTASNKYIIQDDVPPVSVYTSPITPVVKTTNSQLINSGKLCSVQPRFVANGKDSFVVLRPSTTGIRPGRGGLVAVNTSMKSLVAGSCMVPVLFSTSGSAPQSLLPVAARNTLLATQKPTAFTLAAVPRTKPASLANVHVNLTPTVNSPTVSSSILSLTPESLLSSHKLSSRVIIGSSVVENSLTEAVEKSTKSTANMDIDLCAVTNDLTDKDELTDLDQSLYDDVRPSGCMTPITPTSGRATPAYEGRLTPLGFSSTSSCDSTPSPSGGKINIKISGGVMVDVRQENNTRDINNKASRCIGQVGSLTWQNMDCPSTTAPVSAATTAVISPKIKASRVKKENESLLVDGKKKRPKIRTGVPSRAELYRMKETAQNMSELHPLIDHDYCTFTEFTADIQSSIIATTDSKLKTDRKYVKKSKVVRGTKFAAVQSQIIPMKMEPKLKKRKYTKRKLNQVIQRSSKMENEDGFLKSPEHFDISAKEEMNSLHSEPPKEKLRDRKPKRRYRPRNNGDKNYVKIPGCYQDQFVYYATKKTRGGPRKFHDEKSQQQVQSIRQTTANMNEFEWYREMSKIDKGTKFGINSQSNSLELPSLDHMGTKVTTPIHESDVVDMVIDMMPSTGIEVNPTMDSGKLFGPLISDHSTSLTGSNHPSTGSLASIHHSEDSNASILRPDGFMHNEEVVESTDTSTVDPGVMAEFNRLLNSMEESEHLKILENLKVDDSHLLSDKSEKDANGLLKEDGEGTLNNLNAYFGSYAATSNVNTISASHSQFLDLDDINDTDLLNTTELGNFFSDLTSSAVQTSSTSLGVMSMAGESSVKLTTGDFSTFGENSCSSYSMDSNVMDTTAGQSLQQNTGFGKPLDQRELFPDIASNVQQVHSDSGVPDLTLVNMYWNELPGLMINSTEYVRLVDIHKQVLPAKDTGILKKRCQMMGLEIINCSDLQRDFLIRYMNAAKSKSCVIISKENAKTLIGFYVDPRPRVVNKQPSTEVLPPVRTEPSKLKVLLPQRTYDEEYDYETEEETMEIPDEKIKIPKTRQPRTPTLSKTGKQKATPRNKSKSPTPERLQTSNSADIKRSARLKNKKVPYAALHCGSWAGDDEDNNETTSEESTSSNQGENTVTNEANSANEGANFKFNSTTEKSVLKTWRHRPRRPIIMDELELRKLLAKQRKRKLNPKERRRIRRLRDKIHKHDATTPLDDERFHERREKWLKKLKYPRSVKGVSSRKYRQEHGYATSQSPTNTPIENIGSPAIEVDENDAPDGADNYVNVERVEQNIAMKSTTTNNEHVNVSSAMTEMKLSKQRNRSAKQETGGPQHTLQVLHTDNIQRGQRNRTQDGTLHLGKYSSREATCIECNTCHEMLSIRRFLKHRHHLNNPDELVEVSLPQKLEMRDISENEQGSENQDLWMKFTEKRQTFATTVPRRRDVNKVKRMPNVKTSQKPVAMRHKAALPEMSNIIDDGARHSARVSNIIDDGARHSARVRKRKQLHPMESYVFGSAHDHEVKRSRRTAKTRDGLG